jgi:hypothetical protein
LLQNANRLPTFATATASFASSALIAGVGITTLGRTRHPK